jgi:hypothetical protein
MTLKNDTAPEWTRFRLLDIGVGVDENVNRSQFLTLWVNRGLMQDYGN